MVHPQVDCILHSAGGLWEGPQGRVGGGFSLFNPFLSIHPVIHPSCLFCLLQEVLHHNFILTTLWFTLIASLVHFLHNLLLTDPVLVHSKHTNQTKAQHILAGASPPPTFNSIYYDCSIKGAPNRKRMKNVFFFFYIMPFRSGTFL